jgi:hypothetical protein
VAGQALVVAAWQAFYADGALAQQLLFGVRLLCVSML